MCNANPICIAPTPISLMVSGIIIEEGTKDFKSQKNKEFAVSFCPQSNVRKYIPKVLSSWQTKLERNNRHADLVLVELDQHRKDGLRAHGASALHK